MRLISADDAKAIICKYENRTVQRDMIYAIEKLKGCTATDEQIMEIRGDDELELED